MFKFCNLYSGSSGNSSFIESDNTKILVDAGTSCRKIETALQEMNLKISDLDGILITHEHSDHVNALKTLCKKYNVSIYANEKTFNNIKSEIPEDEKVIFKTNEAFEIKDLRIFPFSIPHDAADPCGFTISHDGKKVSVATDVGHAEKNLYDNLVGSSFILLEANYEPEMLKCSPYPYNLKRRILGPDGHLSNEDAGNVISTLVRNGTLNISLGHLSQQNNFPELAYRTVIDSLIENKADFDKLRLTVAGRNKPDNVIEIA
jgi:phosphoribosyl 1,2-cyclic phosphodiesterase